MPHQNAVHSEVAFDDDYGMNDGDGDGGDGAAGNEIAAAPSRPAKPSAAGGRKGKEGSGRNGKDCSGSGKGRKKPDGPTAGCEISRGTRGSERDGAAAAAAGGTASGAFDWRAELEVLSVGVRRLHERQRANVREAMTPLVALLASLEVVFDGEDLVKSVGDAVALACRVANAIVVEADPDPEARARANHVLAGLYYVQQALSSSTVAARILTSDVGAAASICDEDLAAGVARFHAPDPEEANRMQQLLLYLLNTAQSRGYRRAHGAMYQCIQIDEWDTHAWQRVCEMRDFVYEVTRKEVNYDMWLNLTAVRGNIAAAADHLCNCHDVQLPDLRKDRHVFSFANGIYLAADDRFVRYGTPAHKALPHDLVAAKFFEAPMPLADAFDEAGALAEGQGEDEAWYDAIPTPHLQSIMDYQVSFSLAGGRAGASPARDPPSQTLTKFQGGGAAVRDAPDPGS